MKFLDPKALKISEINFTDSLQFDIYARDILTIKLARLAEMFKENVPKPQSANRPITYVVNLFEEKDYIVEEKMLKFVMGLILNALNEDEVTRDRLISKIPESMSSVYATELSILNYLNYSKGNPIQISVTRQYIDNEELVDSEVFSLV